MRETVSHARALHLYDYDSATGHLRYKVRLSPRVKIGDVVGGEADRYRYAKIDSVSFPLHHLVWFHQKGVWPDADLSFKDGNPGNTRLDNLIPQSKSETIAKTALRSTNTTGVKGVSASRNGKFQAHIYGPKGGRALGTHFKTIEDAAAAIEKAKVDGVELRSSTPLQKAVKDAAYHARKCWRALNFVTGGKHCWPDANALFAEVGFAPARGYRLAAKDQTQPFGPGNTCWKLAEKRPVPASNLENLNRELIKKFGITLSEYNSKLSEQNGVCACCANPETRLKNDGSVRMLSVDHDHRTGAVRGLLCCACNVGIGSLQDDPKVLRKAADYLDFWREQQKDKTVPFSGNIIPLKKS